MLIFGAFFAYLAPLIIGLVALSIADPGGRIDKLGEKLALGFAIGAGLLVLYMFYLSLLGIPLAGLNFLPFLVLVVVAAIFRIKSLGIKRFLSIAPRRPFGPLKTVGKIVFALVVLLLIWKLFFSGFMLLNNPTYFDDSVANYNFKAKIFYHHRSIVLEEEDPECLGSYKPWYPPGVSLFKTWVVICAGEWSEAAVNFYTLAVFIALGLIAYYNFIRFLKPIVGLVFTYIILSIPLITFHAGFAYIDIAVVLYFFAGVVYLLRSFREGEDVSLLISALLFSAGILVKDEMLPLFIFGAVPPLLLYWLTNRGKTPKIFRSLLIYPGIVLLPNLPWFILKLLYDLPFRGGMTAQSTTFEFHPEAFGILAHHFFNSGNFNILWPVFFLTLLVSLPSIIRTDLKYVLLSLIGTAVVTISIFIFTPFFEFLKTGMTINRALFALLPVAVLYIAVFYGRLTRTIHKPD